MDPLAGPGFSLPLLGWLTLQSLGLLMVSLFGGYFVVGFSWALGFPRSLALSAAVLAMHEALP
eukprot:2443256-Karenia_brevis.AAC.1